MRIQNKVLHLNSTRSNKNARSNLRILLCENHASVIRVRETKTDHLSTHGRVICATNYQIGCPIYICLKNGEIVERVKGVNLNWKQLNGVVSSVLVIVKGSKSLKGKDKVLSFGSRNMGRGGEEARLV